MLEQVQNFIRQEALFKTSDRLILACSGGKDSMVLLDVLRKLNYAFVVAHCNYNLRGDESEADLVFLKKYCECHQLDFRRDCKLGTDLRIRRAERRDGLDRT